MSWSAFWGGVVVGLAATLVWVAVTRSLEALRMKRKFGRYEGRYSVTRKQETEAQKWWVEVKVRRNVLTVSLKNLPSGDSGGGTILMDEQLRGEGHYWRVKRHEQLWGFWDVQVRDDRTLLLHETYSKAETKTAVLSGYRWTRVESQ